MAIDIEQLRAFVDFLTRAIDADQAAAEEAGESAWASGDTGSPVAVRTMEDSAPVVYRPSHGPAFGSEAIETHIFNWEPRRVVAECEAKRRMVKRAAFIIEASHSAVEALAWWGVLEDIGRSYDNQRGYREEWRINL